MYDYLIVGSGLAGSVFAHEAKKKGKKVLVLEKRDHIGGNCYTEKYADINIHKYGAHIFHTNKKEIWDYVSQFVEFNNYVNQVKAIYKDKLYTLPFNLNTFYEIFNAKTPKEAKDFFSKRVKVDKMPDNLEEQAIDLVGVEIYNILIKGYTEKQWGKSCELLPPDIIRRLPVRFTFNNNYYNDKYQGIPIGGYTQIFEKLLDGIEVKTEVKVTKELLNDYQFGKLIWTGPIDEYFDYCHNQLEYRSLEFVTEILDDVDNYQGNAVINYTEKEIPYTRIIEHKFFEFGEQPHTVITKEYPKIYDKNSEPYYPINNLPNEEKLKLYQEEAEKISDRVIFAGRLGLYKYFDMDKVIEDTLEICKKEFGNE